MMRKKAERLTNVSQSQPKSNRFVQLRGRKRPSIIQGKNGLKEISTVKELEALIQTSPALICGFSATWCGACKSLEPVLDKLEKAYPEITFAKADVDEHQDLSDKHKIRYVPTVFFMRRGKVVRKIEGWSSYEILDKLAKKLLSESTPKRKEAD